jgi:hypothetical protein
MHGVCHASLAPANTLFDGGLPPELEVMRQRCKPSSAQTACIMNKKTAQRWFGASRICRFCRRYRTANGAQMAGVRAQSGFDWQMNLV